MTLNTAIYVLGEIDPKELWVEANRLIGSHEGIKFKNEQREGWRHEEPYWEFWNLAFQGLPALLDLKYQPDGPLRTPEFSAKHDDYCNVPGNDDYDPDDDLCTVAEHDPACWVEVRYDTSYGYRGAGGEGCGDLHAHLVTQLGVWLGERGISWRWKNEFTGDVHDRFDGLDKLGAEGGKSSDWYLNTVAPVIRAMTKN